MDTDGEFVGEFTARVVFASRADCVSFQQFALDLIEAAPPLEVGEDIVSSSVSRLGASCAPPESGGQAGGGG